ncbi:MAG: archease [Cyanobacteriota bacterium]|nr:archease [Cyanobacteriota bacterium]
MSAPSSEVRDGPVGDGWSHFGPAAGQGLGLLGVGTSKERAFEQVGLALTALITDPARVRLRGHEEIQCTAADDQGLLLAWIETLLGRMAVHHVLFGSYAVQLRQGTLAARALGEPLDPRCGHPGLDLHRVLCDQLSLSPGPAGSWRAEVILSLGRLDEGSFGDGTW